jgi:hypothetical protein
MLELLDSDLGHFFEGENFLNALLEQALGASQSPTFGWPGATLRGKQLRCDHLRVARLRSDNTCGLLHKKGS